MTTEPSSTSPIEKAVRGLGPWQDEPDRLAWTHMGLPCLMVRHPLGYWCGYVAVPPGHAAHGQDYGVIQVEVHGGLTYGSRLPDEPEDVFWLGFDCAHAGDLKPGGQGYPWPDQPYNHAQAVADPVFVEVYRDVPYVQAETNRLAEQLAAMGASGGPA